MTSHPPTRPTPGSDPLLGPAATVSRTNDSRQRPPDAAPRGRSPGSPRRHHPARGARALALTASVLATGAVTAVLGYSEGAWGADSTVTASGSPDPSTGSSTTIEPAATAVSTVAADTATPATPNTADAATAAPETAPETTQPADVSAVASGFADGVYLGAAEYTEWGDVQVQVTIADGEIIDVTAVEYPNSRKSRNINDQALPMLEADAIATQSADLDIVSGATYTSRTYADSLQAALDQAALAAAQEGASS